MTDKDLNNKFFKKLIERYLDGLITGDELKLLINYYESFQKENDWVDALGPEKVIKERMLVNILDAIKEDENKQVKLFTLFRNNIFKYSAAAAILIFLGIYFIADSNINFSNRESTVNTVIEPGSKRAILIREDGFQIALEKGTTFSSNNITSDGEHLIYTKANNPSEEIAYNYITIPRGGEFFVELSDGTKVWLNSETKLKYPVTFIPGQTRTVELLYGEAYFDVSPSYLQQGSNFVVINKNQKIEVLGTEFNLKAYEDESTVTTTLVHGKVNINYQGNSHILAPNQQSILDREANTISFRNVDVYDEISWKSGEFSFNNKSLKDIMKVLSRWHDFDVEFQNEAVKNELFVGVLGKKDKIEDILKNLKDIGAINEFRFNDKKILIK